jgi:hypothetical protein
VGDDGGFSDVTVVLAKKTKLRGWRDTNGKTRGRWRERRVHAGGELAAAAGSTRSFVLASKRSVTAYFVI